MDSGTGGWYGEAAKAGLEVSTVSVDSHFLGTGLSADHGGLRACQRLRHRLAEQRRKRLERGRLAVDRPSCRQGCILQGFQVSQIDSSDWPMLARPSELVASVDEIGPTRTVSWSSLALASARFGPGQSQ